MMRVSRAIATLAAVAATTVTVAPVGSVGAQIAPAEQTPASLRGTSDTSIFAPVTLPTPTVYRGANGAPGPKYWQQRADYDLTASLDTATQTVRGTMTLRYTNHSPDTLAFLWLQTEQNAFRENSLNSLVFPQGGRFGSRNFKGGYTFERLTQTVAGKAVSLVSRDQGMVMKVDLARPLAPGQTAVLQAAWHFQVPEHGADRMGRDGTLYELAQWYPKVCVYDDVRGWNVEPYLGQGEFYLEYGNFTLSVTVPAGYIVAATGTLTNPTQVLTPVQVKRRAQAAKSDTAIRIITGDELRSGAARPKTTGTLTWRFSAKNVRDVAWAASPEYQWDASSWKGILAQAYYRPSAEALWREAADMSRESIKEYSERWFQYPYPQISAVEGPVSGMEYPMLAMEDRGNSKYELYNVITHEIGHNWFPMIVGSNERVHFWQDEGFNTFINTFAEAARYPEQGDQMARAAEERAQITMTQAANIDEPIEVEADRIPFQKLGFTEYYKVSVGLQLLRQEILGPDTFDDAFRTYIKRWAFKHPTPSDFYRTMENAGGRRLDWFWRGWFMENPHYDQSIDTVQTRAAVGDSTDVRVVYHNRGRGVLPIRVRFTLKDGSVQDINYPAEVWSTNTTYYSRVYRFPQTVTRIDLDPDKRLVDIDRYNNIWTATASK